jgi:hypothetical protein
LEKESGRWEGIYEEGLGEKIFFYDFGFGGCGWNWVSKLGKIWDRNSGFEVVLDGK